MLGTVELLRAKMAVKKQQARGGKEVQVCMAHREGKTQVEGMKERGRGIERGRGR